MSTRLRLLLLALILSCLTHSAWALESGPVLIRVGLLFDAASCRISSPGGILLRTAEGPGRPLGAAVELRPEADGIALQGQDYAAPAVTLHPASDDPLSLNGKAYRGDLVVSRADSGRLTVVNYVDVESYVRGVLAGEIPAAWPEEALKAQAVAARSYALSKMAHRSGGGWDVVATDRDQVYEGVRGEVPAITRAVRGTAGQVLTWQGQVIKAYFCAACGGHTESAAAAFGDPDEPYLEGVPDRWCRRSPYQTWSLDYSIQDLQRLLDKSGIDFGRILAVEPGPRDASGRVESVTVVHGGGTTTLSGVELRRLLGYRDLRSTRFRVAVAKSVAFRFSTTRDGWRKVEKKQVYYVPQSVSVGMQETHALSATVPPGSPFYCVALNGALDRNRAGYAYAATAGGVLRTFNMRPGLMALGLVRQVVVTRFTVKRRRERVITRNVHETKVEQHTKRLPAVLEFSGHGWGHGVGLCQWGARGMALSGYGYRQILAHYYPGTELSVLGR